MPQVHPETQRMKYLSEEQPSVDFSLNQCTVELNIPPHPTHFPIPQFLSNNSRPLLHFVDMTRELREFPLSLFCIYTTESNSGYLQ